MYKYYNPNPRRRDAGDCVIRAICKAEDKDWETVYTELSLEGFSSGDWGNANSVWDKYLRDKGYKRHTIPNFCPDCYNVGDFAEEYTEGVYIVSTGTHLCTVVDGTLYDAYDSRDKTPIYFYSKE